MQSWVFPYIKYVAQQHTNIPNTPVKTQNISVRYQIIIPNCKNTIQNTKNIT